MNKPPFRATLVLWLVLIFIVWNGFRFWTSISWRETLEEFSNSLDPLYISILSSVWIILGLLLAVSIWSNQIWAGKLLVTGTLAYSVFYWMERLIWQAPHPNWQFIVLCNLVIIFWVLFTSRSLTRERHERKSQNQEIKRP